MKYMLQPTSVFFSIFLAPIANMVYDSSQAGVHTTSVNKLEPDDVYSAPNEAQASNTTTRSTVGPKVEFKSSMVL